MAVRYQKNLFQDFLIDKLHFYSVKTFGIGEVRQK